MATQTLEFNAVGGQTFVCKLFEVGSDIVVATANATEKANDSNRYSVEFVDVPAGAYRMNAFVNSFGGFANEIYDLDLETRTFFPRSEVGAPSGTGGTNGVGDYQITATLSNGGLGISGCRVSIVGSATFDATNALGVAVLNVVPGEYTLRVTPPIGFAAVDDVDVTVVDDDEAVSIGLSQSGSSSEPNAAICEIIDFVLDASLQPVQGAIVRATASRNAQLVNSGVVSLITSEATTDSTGRFVLRLPRADAMTAGKEFTVEIRYDAKNIFRQVTGSVPNKGVALLKELVPPS